MLTRNTNLTLENENLIVTFPGNKAGFDGIFLASANYEQGNAISNEYNNLTPDGELRIASGDFHTLLINDTEYASGQVNWISYKSIANSKDLYGKFDLLGGVEIEVVKVVSSDIVNVGGDRAISGQELMYFFTPDGKGVVKKVRVIVKKLGPAAESLTSARFIDFIGSGSLGPRNEVEAFDFRQCMFGFNYDTLADFQNDWSKDPGLTVSIARNSSYPNLVPGFGGPGWVEQSGTPTAVNARRLDLNAGDIYYLHYFNAYPTNRTMTLIFKVVNYTGTLKVTIGSNRNGRSTDGEETTITNDGDYTIPHKTGEGDNWLYLAFEQISGSSEIHDPAVEYRVGTFPYTTPDGSLLANTNLRNCIRLQSSNPFGKQMVYDFGENVSIGAGKGIALSILPLDGNSIEDGAFKVIFQKPDESWVSSSVQNMFVDYNETMGNSVAERFNLWEDGFFGISLPAGVDEVRKIGIEWVTTEEIDWLLDGFSIINWEKSDEGLGSDVRRRIGLRPKGLRMQDFILKGIQGLVYPNTTTIKGERIGVVVVEEPNGGYREKIPLTHTNLTELLSVYQLLTAEVDIPFSSFTDRGYEAVIDLSFVGNYEYPISVTNLTQNRTWRILSSSGMQITLATAEEDYATDDIIRVEYATRANISSSHYSLVYENNRYYIKWDYDAWTRSHDRDTVYVDYEVSDRQDDSVGLLAGGSLHYVQTLRRMRLDPRISSPLLGTYNTLVFSDPANEIAETVFIYYPVKYEEVEEDLFQTAQDVQDIADNLAVRTRSEPLSPLPRNYSLIPHVAFGGEMIAADPIGYLAQVSEKFYSAAVTNAIVSSGSLTYLRDRDADAWWWWGGGLRDNGIDYLSATRNILRRGLPETTISGHINRHRYLLELTTFAYEYTKRHKNHASTDYKGEVVYRRVWYYEAASGLYTAVLRPWDDFDESYYDSVTIDGTPYYFRYHYILVIPAFWSVTTPAGDWGLTEPTLYDLMARRLDYVCKNYDADGAILSEYIFYKQGYGSNEFSMYNA